jgi:hypothetical protein
MAKGSWAGVPKSEIDPTEDKQIEAMAEVTKAEFSINIALVKVLSEILAEMRKQTQMYAVANELAEVSADDPTDTAVDNSIEDDETGEESDMVPRTVAPKVVIPSNIKDEAGIISYYKNGIASLKDGTGAPLFGPELIPKFQITVEESSVRVKLPWMGDKSKFGGAIRGLESIGGEYIKDGPNTHFRMPKPATP